MYDAIVVGADGARSWIREAAGMFVEPRDYGQTAVVANFACERAHRGRARQWFQPDGGVLAWLPLPGRRVRREGAGRRGWPGRSTTPRGRRGARARAAGLPDASCGRPGGLQGGRRAW